jgi:DNA-binding GntR family transcriptional regulator
MTGSDSHIAPALRRPAKLSLPDLAYETIVEAIIDGRLAPGTRLSIDYLARELDMSNTPIREALSRASAVRLVNQQPNRGYTVAPLLSEAEYHQLFDARHLIETYALEIGKLDTVDVAYLVALNAQMAEASTGPSYREFNIFNKQDGDFHRALVRASGNPFLINAWDNLHFHLQVGRLYTGAGVIDRREALEEHAAIIDAIHGGNRQQAVQLASRHIRHAEQRLKHLVHAEEPTHDDSQD